VDKAAAVLTNEEIIEQKTWSNKILSLSDTAKFQCNGQQQSPINIPPAALDQDVYLSSQDLKSQLRFFYVPQRLVKDPRPLYDYPYAMRALTQLPATPEELLSFGQKNDPGPQRRSKIVVGDEEYEMKQVVLKSPSEHTVGGRRYAFEVQILHQNTFDPDKQAAISVFFDVAQDNGNGLNSEGGPILSTFLAGMQEVMQAKAVGETGSNQKLDMYDAFPAESKVFSYHGSETAPPCKEQMLWFIMSTPSFMSLTQLHWFRQRFELDGAHTVIKFEESATYSDKYCCLKATPDASRLTSKPCGGNARPTQVQTQKSQVGKMVCSMAFGPKAMTCNTPTGWA